MPGRPAEPRGIRRLVRYLEDQVGQGFTLLTWNGLGFDLDVLQEESGISNRAGPGRPTWT